MTDIHQPIDDKIYYFQVNKMPSLRGNMVVANVKLSVLDTQLNMLTSLDVLYVPEHDIRIIKQGLVKACKKSLGELPATSASPA